MRRKTALKQNLSLSFVSRRQSYSKCGSRQIILVGEVVAAAAVAVAAVAAAAATIYLRLELL